MSSYFWRKEGGSCCGSNEKSTSNTQNSSFKISKIEVEMPFLLQKLQLWLSSNVAYSKPFNREKVG